MFCCLIGSEATLFVFFVFFFLDGNQQVCQSGWNECVRHQEALIWPQKSNPGTHGPHNHQSANGHQQGSEPGAAIFPDSRKCRIIRLQWKSASGHPLHPVFPLFWTSVMLRLVESCLEQKMMLDLLVHSCGLSHFWTGVIPFINGECYKKMTLN